MKPKPSLTLHPFLLAAYAVLALLASNVAYVQGGALRSLALAVLGAGALSGLLALLLKNSLRAGLVASGLIFALVSYGHVQRLVAVALQRVNLTMPAWVLILFYVVLVALWSVWVIRGLADPLPLTQYLNIVSLILVIFPLYSITTSRYTRLSAADLYPQAREVLWQQAGVSQQAMPVSQAQPLPDIYYLVLDAYTRADILDELYDYDNEPFLDFLRQRGFYVAEASRANYVETELSIASSLNLSHLTGLADFFAAQGVTRWDAKDACNDLIQHNRLAELLRRQGYTFVVFDSGVGATQIFSADEFVASPDIRQVNSGQLAFEMLLLDTSLGKVYLDLAGERFSALQTLFTSHRQRIRYTLDHLPDYAGREGSYFVFAHVISPHTPFVFGPNGEELPMEDPYTLLDAHPGQEQNVALYRGQVQYLNSLLQETIERILQQSETPPIIILQGDHSSRAYKEKNPSPELHGKLIFPILNAYRVPERVQAGLYPAISPVNSFRVLLRELFGLPLDRLPDAGYVLDEGRTHFLDICRPESGDVHGLCAP